MSSYPCEFLFSLEFCSPKLVIRVWEKRNNLKSQFVLSHKRVVFGGWSLRTEEPLALQFKLHESPSSFPVLPLWWASPWWNPGSSPIYCCSPCCQPENFLIHRVWLGGWGEEHISRGDYPWCYWSFTLCRPQCPPIRLCLQLAQDRFSFPQKETVGPWPPCV